MGDVVVPLWFAEGATEVGDDLFTVLPLLSKHCSQTHVAGISVNHKGFLGVRVSKLQGLGQGGAELGESCSAVLCPPEGLALLSQSVR